MSTPVRVAYTMLQCWHRVPGGTASSAIDMARALDARDDVVLRGVGPAGTRIPDPPWTPPLDFSRVPVPYQVLYDIWHYTPFLSPSNVRGRVDVVHATAATVPSSKGKPLLVTVHDIFPLKDPQHFTKRGVRIMTRGIEMARRRADLISCPSVDTADDLIGAGFDSEKIRIVPHGARSQPATDAERNDLRSGFQLNRPFVLWVGTIEPRKNLPTLLQAFSQIERDDVDLVLVGPPGWDHDLEAHVESVSHRVRRLGFVPEWALGALYAEAEVFAMPSLREGFGLPVIDAMAQGCPVVVSADTALEEVAGDAGTAVDPLDVEGWTAALDEVLGDSVVAQQMSDASLQRSRRYTWESAAEQTVALYNELNA